VSLVATAAGCTDAIPSAADGGSDGSAACWPGSASTRNDAEGVGCAPLASFPVCQVPSGSTPLADGAALLPDGAPAEPVCNDACGVSEYVLSCLNATPDTALRCVVVPIAGQSGATFYCCPCAGTSP
jgi:hypothetical protein